MQGRPRVRTGPAPLLGARTLQLPRVVKNALKPHGGDSCTTLASSTLLIRIAGLTLGVSSPQDGPSIVVSGAAGAFAVNSGIPDVDVNVTWGDLDSSPRGRLLFDSGGVWKLHEERDRLSFSFSSPALGGVYRNASFDREFRRGMVALDRAKFKGRPPVYPLEYPLDELIVINRLALEDGIEVHGCGIVDTNGRGYLFAGQSGAGKSTIARLWSPAGATVLSDDRVVLRKEGGGVVMHGTPWHGDAEYAEPRSAPLAGILFLRQAPAHRIVPLLPAHAGGLLFSCAFPVFHSAKALERTLAFIERTVSSVPVAALECAPTPDIVSFVRQSRLR